MPENDADTWVAGDLNFEGVDAGSLFPTLKNVGNTPLYVEAHFTPFVLDVDPTKSINRFDLKMRAEHNTNPADITSVDVIMASEWYCFQDQPIGSNQVAKIDFSIHPTAAQAGAYSGMINLLARGTDCTGHDGLHSHP